MRYVDTLSLSWGQQVRMSACVYVCSRWMCVVVVRGKLVAYLTDAFALLENKGKER